MSGSYDSATLVQKTGSSSVFAGAQDTENRGSDAEPTDIDKTETNVRPPAKQYDKVRELARLGVDRLAISKQTDVPIGEVNLILELSK